MHDAFYEPLGDGRYRSTRWTTGPWDAGAQHGGPPSALLAREVLRTAPRDDAVVARVTVEILGPVPVGEVEVAARVVRPGRSVELVEAVLRAGGRDAARASAWRVRRSEGASVPPVPDVPPRSAEAASGGPAEGWVDGYLSAVEWRLVAGSFLEPGPATAWTRLRVAVVAGEEPTGLERALAVADSGNGLSSELDIRQWWFINPELTVHLHREPAGEWVCVDARTLVSDGGAGLATTLLSDDAGPFGVGAQALLVGRRPGAGS